MSRSSAGRLGPLVGDLLCEESVALLHPPPVQEGQGPARGYQQGPVHRQLIQLRVVGQIEAGQHAEIGMT